MKTTFPFTAAILGITAALVLGATNTRADDDTKTARHHHRSAQKANAPVPSKDDRNAREVKGDVVGGATGPEYRVRTGTHLPEHYNRRGYTTDSRDNEVIYDKNDIRLQNSNTVSDSLRQIPGVNVGRQ